MNPKTGQRLKGDLDTPIQSVIYWGCQSDESKRLDQLAGDIMEWTDQMDIIFDDESLSEDEKVYLVDPDNVEIGYWKDFAQAYMITFNRDFHSHYNYEKPGHHDIHEWDKVVLNTVRIIARELGVEIDLYAGLEGDDWINPGD